jgi:hypothetical protein
MMPERTTSYYLGLRIAANAVSALVIVLLIVNSDRDLTTICALLSLVVALWLGPVMWRKLVK